jgi:hypothetical protein
LEPTLSDFAELLKIAKQLKQQDRSWTDELSQDAFLLGQPASKRKDSQPEGRSKVAYFLIDPLCHEMAKEFFSDLGSPKQTKPTVTPSTPPKARSAELPTFKPIGPKRTEAIPSTQTPSWPLLATEKNFQRFRKDLKSLKTDASTVRKSEEPVCADKASSPRQRVEFLKLKEVGEQTTESLEQRCSEADLIVVDAKELNQSAETKVSLVAFGHWIEQVQRAWDRLYNLGVQEFVFITGNSGQSVASTGEPSAPQEAPVLKTPPESSKHDRYQIEAEAKPEMLGYSRLQIRVKSDAEESPDPEPKMIHVALRVPERPDIQVTIKDAPGAVMNNLNKHQLAIALNQDWTEVLFDLIGPQDERVPVEVYFPEAEAEIESAIAETHFRAVGASPDALQEADALGTSTPTTVPIPQNSTWQDSFEDENIRTVFIHLQRHGSVTEHELTQFLGGARKARSFSLAFEEYLKKVPFSVRIETTASGKRYVKET